MTDADAPDDETPAVISRVAEPARLTPIALILFAAYVLCYAGFVLVCAFAPNFLAEHARGQVNAAVPAGLFLIALAFVVAVAYVALSKPAAGEPR